MLSGSISAGIFSLFIISITSQSTNRQSSCFPLNSRRFLSCPPGHLAKSLSPLPLPSNILERRLFIRKLRNPSIPPESTLCCRVGFEENLEENAEKLPKSKPKFAEKLRRPKPGRLQEQNEGRRRRRKRPKSRIHAIINLLGESVDQIIHNTSLNWVQYGGWTYTFRPFKVFHAPFSDKGEDQVFEKYRTRRGRGRGLGRNRNNLMAQTFREPLTTTTTTSTSTTPPPPPPPPTDNHPEFPEGREFPLLPPLQKALPKNSRIIQAPPSSPYLVSIRRGGNHFCSGVALDSKHVLTAANCFVSSLPGSGSQELVVNVDPAGVSVVAVNHSEEELSLDHICVHNTVPHAGKELNEVAVLTLANQTQLVFTKDFFPARLLWEEKGDLANGANNYASWLSSTSELMESAPIKQVDGKVCGKRHRFLMRKDEVCLQLGRRQGKSCSKGDFLGGVLECGSGLGGGRTQVCGVITETSCPPTVQQGHGQDQGRIRRRRKNPVTKISPIPKWIYPILSSNSYRNCF